MTFAEIILIVGRVYRFIVIVWSAIVVVVIGVVYRNNAQAICIRERYRFVSAVFIEVSFYVYGVRRSKGGTY